MLAQRFAGRLQRNRRRGTETACGSRERSLCGARVRGQIARVLLRLCLPLLLRLRACSVEFRRNLPRCMRAREERRNSKRISCGQALRSSTFLSCMIGLPFGSNRSGTLPSRCFQLSEYDVRYFSSGASSGPWLNKLRESNSKTTVSCKVTENAEQARARCSQFAFDILRRLVRQIARGKRFVEMEGFHRLERAFHHRSVVVALQHANSSVKQRHSRYFALCQLQSAARC